MDLSKTGGHRDGDLHGVFDQDRLNAVSEHPIVQCAVGSILMGEEAILVVESLEPTLIRMARKHDLDEDYLAIGFSIAAIQSAQEHARGRRLLDTPNLWVE